ncbi:MAG: hypothetical protein OEZ44_02810 [Candidatus Bathyarchaeota archaeon]|nr:hypothetical protein [Candidatus Bathyarchaeota archaeon]
MERKTSLATLLVIAAALSLWLIMYNQSQILKGEFGIYLTRDNTKVVSDSDIQYYNVTSHELTLTSECAERLKTTKGYLEGNFTIIVHGEVELRGLFVPPFISRSYPSSQAVIVYPTFESSYKTMKIQMGYPWNTEPFGQDPLENPRITQYLEESGKLAR